MSIVSRTISAVVEVLIMALPACGGDMRDAEWSGTIRDSAEIRLVHNPETGLWTDETRWTVEEDLRIGVIEGDPEYEFGRIGDIDAGRDGRIYVLDNQAGKVNVYAADGAYLLSFGGFGKGPGEFSIGAFAIVVDPRGNVVVRDALNRRDNVFGADGTYLRSIPLRGPFREWAVLPDGDHLERSWSPTWDGLIRTSGGEISDTLLAFQYDIARSRGALSSGPTRTSGGRTEIPLLAEFPSWGITSDGRVISGLSGRYRIEVRRPDGGLDMLIEKDHGTRALHSEDRARLIDRLKESMRRAGLSEDAIAGVFQRFSYIPPDSLPAFTGLAAGPDGTIWVRGVLPIDSMTANDLLDALNPGSPVWDVFAADGRYLGQVVLPPRFTLRKIRAIHIYGVETGELDVQRVVRLRIRGPKGP